MARLNRAEIFDPRAVAIGHLYSQTVRRCFLMGDDPVSGKNFDHRKVWIENHLQQLSAFFGIDLLGFAILSNHFHLILRSRPDVVAMCERLEDSDYTSVQRRIEAMQSTEAEDLTPTLVCTTTRQWFDREPNHVANAHASWRGDSHQELPLSLAPLDRQIGCSRQVALAY
ncbi:hypothetical protein Pla100_23700 [Neorhodopirellula pilleata]|uniref:Transposase IS200-like domain-containing protein n=1 Tax=Neorhodopirellula pilleata TaxID=2714738 RepID=A0A5C6ACS5_9BACT|nr:hypothetical protein Pla100_23700 [Neorhodopirellula pilleata]